MQPLDCLVRLVSDGARRLDEIVTQVRQSRHVQLSLACLVLGALPRIVHAAGIWNGGLCTVYQDVMDNELLEIVSLVMLVGSLILWGLDDGRSNVKTAIIRGVAVTMAIINMPLLWAQVFNQGQAC